MTREHQQSRNKPRTKTDVIVRKIPADRVPYGSSITHKRYVWAAYDGDTLVAVAATSQEVRRKYREIKREMLKGTC